MTPWIDTPEGSYYERPSASYEHKKAAARERTIIIEPNPVRVRVAGDGLGKLRKGESYTKKT